MIEVRALRKDYRSGSVIVPALRGIDFAVGEGEFVAVVGPSGCGKSTLLYVIGGMLRATSGAVTVDGFEVTGAPERELARYRRNRVGFVFQKFNLLGSLDVRGNLEVACRIGGRRADAREVEAVLDAVGMAHKRHARPAELSQGEQQRVAIARALVREPRLLLADEPTGNLDSENSRAVLEIFRRLASDHRRTILMITHNESLARAADRIVALRDGRTVEVGRPEPEEARA